MPELTAAKSVLAAGAPQGRLHVGSLRSLWLWPSGQWIQRGLWAGIISLVLLMGVMAVVPPVSRDALTHHLAVPKLYLQHGGMVEIPAIEFSYYPMNLDLLYLLPLYFGNDILPKFIHFAFALATAGLIFGYLRRRTTMNLALAGALFFLSLPVIVKLSITVYVDLGLIFFTTWSLLSLFTWRETGFRARDLVIAAVACGLALGTKYNALPAFLLLTFLVPVLYVRNQPQNAAASQESAPVGRLFRVDRPGGVFPVDDPQPGLDRQPDLPPLRRPFQPRRQRPRFLPRPLGDPQAGVRRVLVGNPADPPEGIFSGPGRPAAVF